MDIKNLIESRNLEFKKGLPSNKRLATEIIALANTRGGRLIIGYDQSERKVVGIDLSQDLEEKIANIVSDLITPQIDYFLSYQTIDKKTLLIINIEEAYNKPIKLKNKSLEEAVYIRIGSTTRLADKETLRNLIREGKNLSFDAEPIRSLDKLDKYLLSLYLEKRFKRLGQRKKNIGSILLRNLDLQKKDKYTVAGALLFTKEPQSINVLSLSYIKAARFKGRSKGIIIDNQEILGPITEQVDEAINFIKRNSSLRSSVKDSQRKDRFEYPPEITREVLVNAVIHRDYSLSGSCIQLAIFDDRLEITSPGALPGVLDIKNLKNVQYNRNPIIARRMFEMGYSEGWGMGIDKILNWAETENRIKPKFIDDDNQFTVIIYSDTYRQTKFNNQTISTINTKILNYINSRQETSNKDLREKFNLTKSQAQQAIRKLMAEGLISKLGAGRSTRYIASFINNES